MKKYLLSTLLLSAILVPGLASAQATATTTVVTPAENFTLCQQASIEKRDTSLGEARTAYNTSMSAALSTRKDAEKAAIGLTDATAKKAAIKVATDAYKVSVTNAQNTLKSARASALTSFEADVKNCRDQRLSDHTTKVTERKTEVAEKQAEIQTLQAERKAAVEVKQSEIQTIRETFKARIDALRSFFKGKPAVTVTASTTVNQ